MFEAIVTLTALAALASAISIIKHESWWIRVLDFPRLQLAVFAAALMVFQLVVLDFSEPLSWILLAIAFAALLHQGWWIIPYTRFYRKEVKRSRKAQAENRIRLLSVNVLTPNRKSKRLLTFIEEEDPDIVIAVEADQWWQDQLDVLETRYPYTLKCPLDNLYGMLLYSRLPLTDPDIQYLVEDQVPSMHSLVNLPSGRQVQLHAIHPAPPSPTENEESTERDAELVIVGRNAAEADYPVIVTGDLNDVAWSATTQLFRRVSGLLDPRIGRGMFNTFNAKYPLIRWPLDHVFHSDDFTLVTIRKLGAFGSDHFPILIELTLEPRAGADQDTPDTDAEDRQWATEKAKAKGVTKDDVHSPGEQ